MNRHQKVDTNSSNMKHLAQQKSSFVRYNNVETKILRGSSDQSGFSFAEVMIALVVLGVTVSGMLAISNTMTRGIFNDKVAGGTACISEANKIIANIKEIGLERSRYQMAFPLAPAAMASGPVNPPSGDTAAQEGGIPFTTRWPTTRPLINTSTNPMTVVPSKAIMGYMNVLEEMYLTTPTICTTGIASVSPYTNIITPISTSSGLVNPTLNFRIQRYLLQDSSTVACGTTGGIRPQGSYSTTATNYNAHFNLSGSGPAYPGMSALLPGVNYPAAGSLGILQVGPDTLVNSGYMVTVTVGYTDRAGTNRSCTAQEKFHYGVTERSQYVLEIEDSLDTNDDDYPEGLNTTIIGSPQADTAATNTASASAQPYDTAYTSANPPHYRACSDTSANNINLRIQHTRSGSIFMCRSYSAQRGNTTPGNNGYFRVPGIALGQRGVVNTFESTELAKKPYYAALLDASPDKQFTGIYYWTGDYYCNGNATYRCPNIPKFPTLGSSNSTFNPLNAASTPGYFHPTNPATNFAGFYYQQYQQDGLATSTAAANTWRPCEQISVCGVNPASSGYNTANNSYEMTYNNLPNGCEVNIQFAEIDAGYNINVTEVKEYMQEKVPGDRACFNAYPGPNPDFAVDSWYFVCTEGRTSIPNVPLSTDCSSAPFGSTACCINYPKFPSTPDVPANYYSPYFSL